MGQVRVPLTASTITVMTPKCIERRPLCISLHIEALYFARNFSINRDQILNTLVIDYLKQINGP